MYYRKRTLLANNILSIAAALLVVSAKYLNVYEIIIVARFLAGINVGKVFIFAIIHIGICNGILIYKNT